MTARCLMVALALAASPAAATFNRPDVASFQIRDTYMQLDNVVIDAAPPTGAVPEPAGWAMLIAGFGLIGAVQRRRSQPRTTPA